MKAKTENALSTFDVINGEIIKMRKKLQDISSDLKSITSAEDGKKRLSMINEIPTRIEFEFCNLRFYIDFTISSSGEKEKSHINGNLIYGVNRTLCFNECISIEKKGECQQTARCDNLEDKPILSFSVNRQGLIAATGSLEGEWWLIPGKTKKRIDQIKDLHYRAMEHIWEDALSWTNEKLIP